jgi:hypothetical protein
LAGIQVIKETPTAGKNLTNVEKWRANIKRKFHTHSLNKIGA